MTDLRKAAEMALEALNSCEWDHDWDEMPYQTFDNDLVNNAKEELHQALAQNPLDIADRAYFAGKQAGIAEIPEQGCGECGVTVSEGYALYCVKCVEPMFKKEWVSLTDEEVHEAAIKCVKSGQSVNAAIRAIEAKLKEKNT